MKLQICKFTEQIARGQALALKEGASANPQSSIIDCSGALFTNRPCGDLIRFELLFKSSGKQNKNLSNGN